MLNYEELKYKFDNDILQSQYSDEALQAVEDLLDLIKDGELTTPEEVYDTIWEVMDTAFIYYDDAWDFMGRWGDTDLSGYVAEGFHTITQMAAHVCDEQVYEILNELEI